MEAKEIADAALQEVLAALGTLKLSQEQTDLLTRAAHTLADVGVGSIGASVEDRVELDQRASQAMSVLASIADVEALEGQEAGIAVLKKVGNLVVGALAMQFGEPVKLLSGLLV